MSSSYSIISIANTRDYIRNIVNVPCKQTYYDLGDLTLAAYEPAFSRGLKLPPRLDVSYLGSRRSAQGTTFPLVYNLTRLDLGPFDLIEEFIPLVRTFQITLEVIQHLPKSIAEERCYVWTIMQIFDYSLHSVITSTQEVTRRACSDAYGRV
jgi:hypothetical protein